MVCVCVRTCCSLTHLLPFVLLFQLLMYPTPPAPLSPPPPPQRLCAGIGVCLVDAVLDVISRKPADEPGVDVVCNSRKPSLQSTWLCVGIYNWCLWFSINYYLSAHVVYTLSLPNIETQVGLSHSQDKLVVYRVNRYLLLVHNMLD